jgi:hypothetical protein
MPSIPDYTSREGYGFTPQPGENPAAAGQVGSALQQGMAQVQQSFAELDGRTRQIQQVADASTHDTKYALAQTDLQQKYAKDPDPSTAYDRYQAEATKLREDTLGQINDPAVRSLVGRNIEHRFVTGAIEMKNLTFKAGLAQQDGTFRTNLDGLAQDASKSSNPATFEQNLNQAIGVIAGGRKAGVYTDDQARTMLSGWVASVIHLKSDASPAAARAMLDASTSMLTYQDQARLTDHLRPMLERDKVNTTGAAANATPGIPASPLADSRAMAVYEGMKARGYSDSAAWGFAANALHESSANPATAPGDGGISHGIFQWNKERLTAFQAKYGKLPGQATLDEQLDFAHAELGGSESRAAAAIAAAATPADAARAISTEYLRPKDKAGEAAGRAATAARLSGQPDQYRAPQDIQTVIARADQMTVGDPEHVRFAARAKAIEIFHQNSAGMEQARTVLGRELTDLHTSYSQGITTAEIPEARIRATLPPDLAQRSIDNLRVQRMAGDIFAGVQFSSPEQDAAAIAALSTPGAIASGAVTLRGGKLAGPGLNAAPPSGAEDADTLKTRTAALQQLQGMLAKKNEALTKDPAGYAAASPGVRGQSFETPAAGIDALMAAQHAMGVPPDQMRVLTNQQAADIATRLHKTDPAQADMGQVLDQALKDFGPHANQAFGELVQHGKISPAWRTLAAMNTPEQAVGRADLQRALVFMDKRGGREKMRQDVPPADLKAIHDNLDGTIGPFRDAYRFNSGGLDLINTVRQSVETLAMYRAVQGMEGGKALASAYDDIVGKRWEPAGNDRRGWFGSSTMLVPKGQAQAVELATAAAQRSLSAGDLMPISGDGVPMKPDERAAATLAAAQNGLWVPNRDGSGVVLMGHGREGSLIDLRRADGSRVELTFEQIRTAPPASRPDPARDNLLLSPRAVAPADMPTFDGAPDTPGPATDRRIRLKTDGTPVGSSVGMGGTNITNQPVGATFLPWLRK